MAIVPLLIIFTPHLPDFVFSKTGRTISKKHVKLSELILSDRQLKGYHDRCCYNLKGVGQKDCPTKIYGLLRKPMIAWTIEVALFSKCFKRVVVSQIMT